MIVCKIGQTKADKLLKNHRETYEQQRRAQHRVIRLRRLALMIATVKRVGHKLESSNDPVNTQTLRHEILSFKFGL